MNTQKGFISIGILLAIILGVVVVGGGAYYLGHQSAAPAAQPNYPDISTTQQTQQQPTTNTSVQATTNTVKQPPSTPQSSNPVSPTAPKPSTQPSGPSATIDQSSLTSATTPKLSGTVTGTSQIIVAVWQGNLSPSEMNYSTNSKAERWASNTQIRNPEVSVSGGRWSTSIGNSEVAGLGGPTPYFPNGTYTVSVADANTGKILTYATLQITGPSIEVMHTDTSTVSFSYVGLPANSQILLAGQSGNPPVVATVSGTGSSSFSIPGGLDGTYWLQVQLNGNSNNTLQSGPFSANWTGR